MLRTPRERFNSGLGGAWIRLIKEHSSELEEATITALLELQQDLPLECAVPQMACDAHQQMVGARKVIDILCSLHQPQSPPKPNMPKGLDYSAGV